MKPEAYSISIKSSIEVIKLLDARARQRYLLMVAASCLLNILDIFALVSLGAVSAIALNLIEGKGVKSRIELMIDSLFDLTVNPLHLTIALSVIAFVLLSTRTIAGLLISRRISLFLANCEMVFASQNFSRIFLKDLNSFYGKSIADYIYIFGPGVSRLVSSILMPLSNLASDFVLLSIALLLAAIVSPVTTFATSLFLFIGVIITNKVVNKRNQELGFINVKKGVSLNRIIAETYGALRELIMLDGVKQSQRQFETTRREFSESNALISWYSSIPKYVLEILVLASTGLLLLIELTRTDAKNAIVTAVVFFGIAFKLIPAVQRIQISFITIRNGLIASTPSREFFKELDEEAKRREQLAKNGKTS